MTELVDHLPLSDKVPSPDKVLGYIVGTPNKANLYKGPLSVLSRAAKSSPRVRIFSAPERSEEGREQILIAVGDEAALAKLDRYKEITAKLADPRRVKDAEAQSLIGEGKAFYWLSGSIHSPETGSPEMLMELAYRLAVEESPFIQAIRKNVIVMITPVLEVDGRDRMVDVYNYRKANPTKNAPSLIYWGKYVAHDNNRDGLGMALALTRNMMATFLEYHPAVLHDLHESVPFLYTSTGTGPYNAWLDPITIDEWQLLAYHEVEEMTKRGVPGVWTHGFYDGWAPITCSTSQTVTTRLAVSTKRWQWRRRYDRPHSDPTSAARLVPAESAPLACEMVVTQQRQHAAVGRVAGDELCGQQQGPLPPEFLHQEQTLGCQGD